MNIARKTLARAATALTAAAVLTSTVAVVSAGPALAQATSLHQFLAATWKFQQDMKTMTYGPSLSHARLIADTDALYADAEAYAAAHGGPYYTELRARTIPWLGSPTSARCTRAWSGSTRASWP